MKKNKGQSTVEYLIIVAAVVAAGLVFLNKGGVFQKKLNATLDSNINSMIDMGERILK